MKRNWEILILFILMFGLIIGQMVEIGQQAQQIEALTKAVNEQKPEVVDVHKGQYTVFQYTNVGWTNPLYATAYYKKDGITYAELRDYPGEFIPVDGQTLPIPEWIETGDKLMQYGFWEPMESDW